ESGNDRKGEHLYVYANGRFGCVIYPAAEGKIHRQRILELTGMKERQAEFRVNKIYQTIKQPIIKDVLGHLGRLNLTFAHSEPSIIKKGEFINEDNPKIPVPIVPKVQKTFNRTPLD